MRPRDLVALTAVLAITGCSYRDWTESVLTYTGSDLSGEEIIASLTERLEATLTPRGFSCEPHEVFLERGHTVLYAACTISDVNNPLQGTETSVNVSRPEEAGDARVQVHTGHVTMHPFTPSNRAFLRWAELVETILCGFPDFDVEHSWPDDSDHPISC